VSNNTTRGNPTRMRAMGLNWWE